MEFEHLALLEERRDEIILPRRAARMRSSPSGLGRALVDRRGRGIGRGSPKPGYVRVVSRQTPEMRRLSEKEALHGLVGPRLIGLDGGADFELTTGSLRNPEAAMVPLPCGDGNAA
jgi:hypothetical protein